MVNDQSAGDLDFLSVPLKSSLSYHDRYCLVHTKAYFVHIKGRWFVSAKNKGERRNGKQEDSLIFEFKGPALNIYFFDPNSFY